MGSGKQPASPAGRALPAGRRLVAPGEADQERERLLRCVEIIVLVCPFAALLLWYELAVPLAVMVVAFGVSCLALGVATHLRLSGAMSAQRLWHHQHDAAVLIPTLGPMIWDMLFVLIISGGCLAALVMMLLAKGGLVYSRTGMTAGLASTTISLAVAELVRYPFTRPGVPAIALTPQGVWLWPHNRRRAWVPWRERPSLAGVITPDGDAVVTTRSGGGARFPMASLSLAYTQLGRVLALFTTHPELRPALAYPEGLALVRALMHTPLEEIEQRLAGGVGTPPR